MNFKATAEFSKELKKFQKKWKTMKSDLLLVEKLIENLYSNSEFHDLFFSGKKGAILSVLELGEVVKMRLDCASSGAKGLLRLTFIFIRQENVVTFVELYSKSEKSREDKRRIDRCLSELKVC
jgi:hypothetical protein